MRSSLLFSSRCASWRTGSLGSYVGEVLGKPIITLELPEGAEKKDAATLWEEYNPALIAFVRGI